MKKKILIIAQLVYSLVAFAQLNGDGYYRIQNFATERWLYLVDNKSDGINYTSTSADVAALLLSNDEARKHYDPACIVYVQNASGTAYDFKAQGESLKEISGGQYLNLAEINTSLGMTYSCSFSSNGYSVFLWDDTWVGVDTESRVTTIKQNSNAMKQWQAFAVNSSDDSNYFGIKPDVEIDGKYYKAFYAAFPFKVKSDGMAVYYASELINSNTAVTVVKVDGNAVVPASTPVFIECSSSDYSNNRIDIVDESGTPFSCILSGNYFCNDDKWYPKHKNVLVNNQATMRVLGKMGNGLLGYVTSSEQYIPANSSYLVVPEGSPSELPLSGAISGISSVTVGDAPSSTAVYTLQGVKVADSLNTSSLPKGIYIVGGKKVVVK